MQEHREDTAMRRRQSALAPAPPVWQPLEPSPEARRQSDRHRRLVAALAKMGLKLCIDTQSGEFQIVELGGSIPVSDGRLFLSHVRTGRPRLASVLRAWAKRVDKANQLGWMCVEEIRTLCTFGIASAEADPTRSSFVTKIEN